MATSSFFEDLIIDTPEVAAALEKAFKLAEDGKTYIPTKKTVICTDKKRMDRFMYGHS